MLMPRSTTPAGKPPRGYLSLSAFNRMLFSKAYPTRQLLPPKRPLSPPHQLALVMQPALRRRRNLPLMSVAFLVGTPYPTRVGRYWHHHDEH